ncbi:MAG: CocE/NonD family hydrolase [Chloroflexota bacterium]
MNWTEAFYTLPLENFDERHGRHLPFWKDWVQHPAYDDYWAAVDISHKWSEITAPAFYIGGWYDLWAIDIFENFVNHSAKGGTETARQCKLIVGPWTHAISQSPKVGDIDFGVQSVLDIGTEELKWLDYWLRDVDNGLIDEAPIRLFIMGINQWRNEYEWPLARTAWQKWYLHSKGNANTLRGDGTLSPIASADEPVDQFIYDPDHPVQTVGGNNCCAPNIVPWGPYDQRSVEMRSDVLCFTSAPLAEDMEVTGPIKLVLYAATDGLDTDWTAKLSDVSPSGYAKNLCDGIIRGRFRASVCEEILLEPNQVYEYEIEVGVTGNVFRKGHRIRLDISSSNFPRFDRNLNTGNPLGQDAEIRVAQQTVHHSTTYPSHLVLPIIPKKEMR